MSQYLIPARFLCFICESLSWTYQTGCCIQVPLCLLFMHDAFRILLFLNCIVCHTSCLSEFTSIKSEHFFSFKVTNKIECLPEGMTNMRSSVVQNHWPVQSLWGQTCVTSVHWTFTVMHVCLHNLPSRPWFHNHIHFGHCCLLPTQLNIDVTAGQLHYSLLMFCKNKRRQ